MNLSGRDQLIRLGKDRIIRYNYTAVKRIVYKTISVTNQNLDCSHATSSLDCEYQDTAAATIQVPEMTLQWNRTTSAEVQVISHELSLGLIKTDNIDVWGKVTSSVYPTNRDKIWQLSVPQPGCSMLIYFHEFDIERSQNCKQDYLSVQIRKRQFNIPRYCSTLSRIELGRTKRVQLWIHSGNSTSRRGVYAMYCFSHWPLGPTDLPCSCNGRTHQKAQRSINTNASSAEMTAVENNTLISEYLLDMIRSGENKVAAYLSEGNRLQQHLASKFLEAINWPA
eukprot:Em0020g39a